MIQIDYARIIEASLNEIYVFDADTLHFVDVNYGARKNLGYTLDELQQMTPLNLKPAYTVEAFAALVAPLRNATLDKIIFETYHLRKNGTTYPVEVHLQLMFHEAQKVFVAIILDITQRKRLEKRNSGLGRILEESLNEVYIFDAESLYFIDANYGACKNLGYTLDELQQMTPLDIKPSYTLASFAALIAPLRAESEQKIVFETYHLRKDGTTYPVEIHLQLTTLAENAVFVAIILDITDRREAEQRLLKLQLTKQRTALVQQFITDTSHEFRTSLAIINTKSHLLRRHIADAQHSYVDTIELQVQRITHLVSALQEASVLETMDPDDIVQYPIRLNDMIHYVVNDLTPQVSEKDVTVTLDLQADLPDIAGDAVLVRKALHHILVNAVQFNVQGGDIVVTTRSDEAGCYINVTDSGIGISAADLQHVFDYLYRVDGARSLAGGYGMGLPVARRIIELHGGSIEITSMPQAGTLVTVCMPFTKPKTIQARVVHA